MTVKRATLAIESSGRNAHFEAGDESELLPDDVHPPVLIIEVADFAEALEVVETLNRSKAQKRREKKTTNAESEDEPGANKVETPKPPEPPTGKKAA